MVLDHPVRGWFHLLNNANQVYIFKSNSSSTWSTFSSVVTGSWVVDLTLCYSEKADFLSKSACRPAFSTKNFYASNLIACENHFE